MGDASRLGVRSRYLGFRLRGLRAARGLSAVAVVETLGMRSTNLSRLERAHRGGRVEDVAAMLGWYGVPAQERRELLAHCTAGRGWTAIGDEIDQLHRALADMEGWTVGVRDYAPLTVPPLLQTNEYSMALGRAVHPEWSEDRILQLAAGYLIRQRALRRGAARYHVVIDEAALRRPVGSREVWCRQLEQLIASAGSDTITLRIRPLSAAPNPHGFTVLTLVDGGSRFELVYTAAHGAVLLQDTRREIATSTAVFRRLSETALSPADSLALLHRHTQHASDVELGGLTEEQQ